MFVKGDRATKACLRGWRKHLAEGLAWPLIKVMVQTLYDITETGWEDCREVHRQWLAQTFCFCKNLSNPVRTSDSWFASHLKQYLSSTRAQQPQSWFIFSHAAWKQIRLLFVVTKILLQHVVLLAWATRKKEPLLFSSSCACSCSTVTHTHIDIDTQTHTHTKTK